MSGLVYPPKQCSAGYYCPSGTVQPNETVNACPPGTYTDYHNLTAAIECTVCPAGQACTSGTGGNQKPPQACAQGNRIHCNVICTSYHTVTSAIGETFFKLFLVLSYFTTRRCMKYSKLKE